MVAAEERRLADKKSKEATAVEKQGEGKAPAPAV